MESDVWPALYVADLRDCAALNGHSPEAISTTFATILARAGATVVETAFHGFPGAGVTCVLILSESHAAIHTWPESGTVHVDIFSCSCRLKSLEAIAELGRFFGAANVSVQTVHRADGHGPAPAT